MSRWHGSGSKPLVGRGVAVRSTPLIRSSEMIKQAQKGFTLIELMIV
ncbi:MAG: prepilin-type N-terminal cleavage/methylation domain-containing protein, partial [Burkholderiaceae bacterium]